MRMEPRRVSEWLCALLRDSADADTTGNSSQPTSDDWSALLDLARRHGVTPLLYARLKAQRQPSEVPPAILNQLQQSYLQNAARNMCLYHELLQVLALLNNEGIPVIVLKGAFLAETVYGNIALRTIGDIDLLVPKNDLAKAQRMLLDAGYLRPESSVHIDLHWNIDLSIAKLNIHVEQLWERSRPVTLAGSQVWQLSPEDLLLHLCTHIVFHHMFQCNGLRALCDMKATIQYYRQTMDWAHIQVIAEAWNIRHAVYIAFLLAKNLVAAQIPDETLEDLQPAHVDPHIQAWVKQQIFRENPHVVTLSPYFWKLWIPGTLGEKLSALRSLFLPSGEFISQKYPIPYGSLKIYRYYWIRLKEHLLPYLWTSWQILIGNNEARFQVKEQHQIDSIRRWLASASPDVAKLDIQKTLIAMCSW
jgi:hypothetical protein